MVSAKQTLGKWAPSILRRVGRPQNVISVVEHQLDKGFPPRPPLSEYEAYIVYGAGACLASTNSWWRGGGGKRLCGFPPVAGHSKRGKGFQQTEAGVSRTLLINVPGPKVGVFVVLGVTSYARKAFFEARFQYCLYSHSYNRYLV